MYRVRTLRFGPHGWSVSGSVLNRTKHGEGWTGTFSGPDGLTSGTLVRVQFGQFGTLHADRYTWVTDHAYRVR